MNKRISEFTTITMASNDDIIIINHAGTTSTITVANLLLGAFVNTGDIDLSQTLTCSRDFVQTLTGGRDFTQTLASSRHFTQSLIGGDGVTQNISTTSGHFTQNISCDVIENITGNKTENISGHWILSNLPSSDPRIANAIYNDNGTLKISTGS